MWVGVGDACVYIHTCVHMCLFVCACVCVSVCVRACMYLNHFSEL